MNFDPCLKPWSPHFITWPVPSMRHPNQSIFAGAFMLLFALPACAEGGDPALGQRLAQEWCAKCHAIGLAGASLLPAAPPFRELHLRYNVEDLANPLGKAFWLASVNARLSFRSGSNRKFDRLFEDARKAIVDRLRHA